MMMQVQDDVIELKDQTFTQNQQVVYQRIGKRNSKQFVEQRWCEKRSITINRRNWAVHNYFSILRPDTKSTHVFSFLIEALSIERIDSPNRFCFSTHQEKHTKYQHSQRSEERSPSRRLLSFQKVFHFFRLRFTILLSVSLS